MKKKLFENCNNENNKKPLETEIKNLASEVYKLDKLIINCESFSIDDFNLEERKKEILEKEKLIKDSEKVINDQKKHYIRLINRFSQLLTNIKNDYLQIISKTQLNQIYSTNVESENGLLEIPNEFYDQSFNKKLLGDK